jgi:hypothetical protein
MLSVDSVEPAIRKLPTHLQAHTLNYISSLIKQSEKKSVQSMEFKWAGCTEERKEQYTSGELQKKIL